MSKDEQLAALEKSYEQTKTFMVQRVHSHLSSVNNEEAQRILKECDMSGELTKEQYELLGCFAFTVGNDYNGQAFLTKAVAEKMKDRFAPYNYTNDTLHLFVTLSMQITEKHVIDMQKKFNDAFLEYIDIDKKEIKGFNDIRLAFRNIVNSSMLDISFAVDIDKIIQKTQYTYQDVLKVNRTVNEHLTYMGEAVKHVLKLNQNETYLSLIRRAQKRDEQQVSGSVFLDSLLSLREAFTRFDDKGLKLTMCLTGMIEGIDFEQEEKEFNEKNQAAATETETQQEARLSNEEFRDLTINNPAQSIARVIADYNGKVLETTADIIAFIEKLMLDSDYLGDLYNYLRRMREKFRGGEVAVFDNPETVTELKAFLEETKLAHKHNVETICAEIPAIEKTKIQKLVNYTIKDLVMVTMEQKQSLIGMLVASDISTYNHLQQALTIIESCKVTSPHAYARLRAYLDEGNTINDVFERTKNSQTIINKMSFIAAMLDCVKQCQFVAEPDHQIDNYVDSEEGQS